MKIAIVNDIHFGKLVKHKDRIRASSHLAKELVPDLLEYIEKEHFPDLLIHLGDLIRSESKEVDKERFQHMLRSFQKKKCPIIHLVGNHDIKHMSLQEVEEIWEEMGFLQKSYGMKNIHGFQLIWLGLEADSKNHLLRRLPASQLLWLEKTLKDNPTPTLLFTHCPIDDHQINGNFFFEASDRTCKGSLFLENQGDIQEIISTHGNVQAVFQAHLHDFHAKILNEIPHITCPAMGDNICTGNTLDFPEIYTIVDINEPILSVKVFSKEYCFAGVEYPITEVNNLNNRLS